MKNKTVVHLQHMGVEGNELSRILFKLSDTFMHERIIKGNGKLRDSNGNTTGKWELR